MIHLACTLLALAQADPAKVLDGSYDVKQVYEEGRHTPLDLLRSYQETTISGGVLTLRSAAGVDTAKFTLDASKTPAHIDFASLTTGETRTAAGIYKVEKGELIIVFSKGGSRPTDFKGDGKGVVKLVLAPRPAKK